MTAAVDPAKPSLSRWRIAGLVFVFIWFFGGGVGHFILTPTFTSIVPPYIPFPREMVWFTGVCEIAGALALLAPRLRRIAGWALIALTLCVTPVHIEMLLHADTYAKLGLPALWARLLFQPVVLWIIWAATKPARAPASA